MKISEKITKKLTISIFISLMIILLVFINIYRINHIEKESIYRAEKGVLDLENWDMGKDELLNLDGEWEFYSGELIEPGEDFEKEKRQYIDVPGNWGSHLKGKGLENGSGTYRLNIELPEDMLYGIKVRTVRTSHRIYLNGEKIAQLGNPSLDKDSLISESKYKVGVGNSLEKELELIVHVTSSNYSAGGIIKSLQIGSFDSIMKADSRAIALDVLVVAICLSLSLYFFIMFFQRDRQAYLIYFSGVNLFMGLYLSTMNEQILSLIYNYRPNERLGIQLFSMILTAVCFLRFTYYFFKESINKKITNIITIFTLSILSIIIIIVSKERFNLLDPRKMASMQIGAIISIFITYAYVSYILVKELYKNKDLTEYIIVITTSMISYWVILYIKVFTEIDLGNTPVFIILVMMFSVAGLLSERFQLDYQRSKQLSDKLEKYDKLKDEFFHKSSSKVKETLEIMLDLIKKLLEGKDGVLNESQQESLFRVNQETKGLRRMADDLMDISLIKSKEVELRSGPIDVHKAVKDLLKEMEVLIDYDKSIIIKNKIPKEFPILKADPNKFRQIIYDLVENSIKFTKYGEIIISGNVIEDRAEIKIKDTGIGIKKSDLKEVFDIFYHKNESEDLEEGLGIGLHIVKKLVEIQGGEIYIESIYGQGTTIIFTLPLYTQEDRKNSNIELQNKFNLDEISNLNKEKRLREEKILIVEYVQRDQKILESIVKDLDFQLVIASTGEKALEIIKTEKIDLVILDFLLQDMTSKELCSKIRKDYSMGELPILILTASGRTIDLISSFDYGVNDFQRKPINHEELQSRIQSLLLIKASAAEGLEKEFQYFYSQISPHFLYNTLTSIIGLSYKDGDEARQALNNLSVYLRGKLDIHRKKGFVSLETELELVTAYLEIEELRYGERLEVIYNIEEGLNARIPPLTLQPIVENAVNHGVATKECGKIKVTTRKEDNGFISIAIEDSGKGMTEKQRKELLKGNGNGIGFKNVMERIKILRGASLSLESQVGKGTKVKIIIPEVKDNEKDENNFS